MTHALATTNPFYAARRKTPLQLCQFPADALRVVHIGPATLYQGNCFDILPTLAPVEGVVTDPPYGIGFKYRSYGPANGAGLARPQK